MTSDANMPEEKLDQATADQFIRLLWVAFNNVSMYGSQHPLARKGVENYFSFLENSLKKVAPVTLHVEGENLLCEKWKTSQSVNVGRLVERLKSAGINSISFNQEITQEDIMETFRILADAKNYLNISDVSEALNEQNIKTISLNTFVYKRVSADEAEAMNDIKDTGPATEPSPEQDMKYEELVKNLMDRFFVDDVEESLSLLDQLEILRERYISAEEKSPPLPTDELLNALMYLKSLRSDETDTTRETGHVAKPGKEILFELELLTFELVKKFIQEKYNSGTLSPKQFGRIIRNLFPDPADLRILFPQIKDVLMDKGMTLSDYLNFVHETSIELEEEGFLNLLEQIGGDIGVSVHEISEELKNNPFMPVQLIMLTFKIFSMLGIESEQIIPVLSQSVGLIVKNKTLENIQENKEVTIGELKNNISKMENKFLSNMEDEGVSSELLQDIKKHLDQSSNILTGQVWSEWVIEKVSKSKDLTDSDQIKMLADIMNKNEESKRYLNNLLIVMEEKGYKKELLDDLMNSVSETTGEFEMPKPDKEVKPKKTPLFKFPKEIANQKETKKYLQLEIYRNLRHNTSFSCISISVKQVGIEKDVRPPTNEELADIFREVARLLVQSLRKIDFIGSLGSVKDNYLFVIMTMTDQLGCQKAEARIAGLLNEISIKKNGSVLIPDIITSSMSFEKEETPEIKTIVRRVKARHRKELKLRENSPDV